MYSLFHDWLYLRFRILMLGTILHWVVFNVLTFEIGSFLVQSLDVGVRYHCGGWSEEVNSCILIISYMVYL